MARGWESKGVESQIEAAESKGDRAARKSRTPEDIDRERNAESLELSRTRIMRELANTTSEVRRKTLQAALDHLDDQLRKNLDGA